MRTAVFIFLLISLSLCLKVNKQKQKSTHKSSEAKWYLQQLYVATSLTTCSSSINTSPSVAGCGCFEPGMTLNTNQCASYTFSDGTTYYLCLQGNGNLVVYNGFSSYSNIYMFVTDACWTPYDGTTKMQITNNVLSIYFNGNTCTNLGNVAHLAICKNGFAFVHN